MKLHPTMHTSESEDTWQQSGPSGQQSEETRRCDSVQPCINFAWLGFGLLVKATGLKAMVRGGHLSQKGA